MNKSINKILVASGLVLTLCQVSGPVSAKTADNSQDVRQEVQISTTYKLSPILRRDNIEVSVMNGKVTLSGKVGDGVNKELAEQIALGVKGVEDVDNKIAIEKDYDETKRTADSSFGEMIDDATITARVKSKLLWSKYTDGMDTDVDTKAGKVTLIGETESKTTKELAGRMAMNTNGVMAVDNQLVVQPSDDSKKSKTSNAGQAISDSWITTKVKSTFIYSSNVDSSDISVTTKKGEVTLSGKVLSGAERELAMELAKNVRGVNTVNAKALII
ncbi:BON domain-containing protein [Paraglaciecola sp.]|uniref:BON domain-containing protein n=1 Tax=Paraglaciecola sp. TaxID=1920173 RepID=UPI0030F42A33